MGYNHKVKLLENFTYIVNLHYFMPINITNIRLRFNIPVTAIRDNQFQSIFNSNYNNYNTEEYDLQIHF